MLYREKEPEHRRSKRMESIRLNKYLSDAGICSRRQADRWIEEKRITVNGEIAGMGMKVAPDSEVCLDGKLIKKEEKKTRITSTFFSLHQTDRTVCHFSKISLHKSRPHQHMRKPNLKWESPVKT